MANSGGNSKDLRTFARIGLLALGTALVGLWLHAAFRDRWDLFQKWLDKEIVVFAFTVGPLALIPVCMAKAYSLWGGRKAGAKAEGIVRGIR